MFKIIMELITTDQPKDSISKATSKGTHNSKNKKVNDIKISQMNKNLFTG